MSTSRRQGIALIVVLTIILALMLVATPFLISMLAHERSSQAYLMEEHAQLNAETARNSVVTYLYLTGDAAERSHEKSGLNPTHISYAYDLPLELTPAFGSALPEFVPPPDHLSGVDVQDEQGKVNLRTAPQQVVDLLTQMAARSGARLSDFVTIYSGREAAWIKPQNIRAVDSAGFYVDDTTPYGPGARLQITKRGLDPLVTVVVAQVPLAGTDPPVYAVATNPTIPDTYLDAVVELEARHPVNILTASEDVLTALFTGLALPPDFEISAQEAAVLASQLRASPPTSFADFAATVQMMTSYGWAQEEVDLVLRGAVNPTDASVTGGTLPICFVSRDAFTINAAGAVVPSPGVQTAMRSLREIVQLAPPYPVTWDLESQYDFQRFLGEAGTFPFGNKLFTTPGDPTMPDTALMATDVEVRQIHAEDLRGNATFREHFPDELDGRELAEGETLVYPWGQIFVPNNPYFDVRAGGFEMWFRFEDEVPTTALLFDIRRTEFADRMSLEYVDGEMILSAADTGLPTVYIGGARTVGGLARVVTPFDPKPNTWVHAGAYWKSTKFGHLALLIDGFTRPDSRFEYVDAEGRRLDTTAVGGVAIGSTSITLGSPALLAPDGITALEIGREVVEYDPVTKTYSRGMRGTYDPNDPTTLQLQEHPAGAKVTLFGYTQRLHDAQLPGQLSLIQVNTLTTGGARTASAFGDTIGVNLETGFVGYAVTPADLGPGAASFSATYPTPDEFAEDGYVLIVSGNIQAGNYNIEVIKYANRSTGGGMVTFTGINRAQQGTSLPKNDLQMHPAQAWVFPYSIKVSDNSNYPDTCIIQIGDEWFPVRKDAADKAYFLSLRFRGFHFPLARATFKTIAQAHVIDEKVIPVFATKSTAQTDMHRVSDYQAGRDDRVTIIDAGLNRRLRRIHHATTQARIKIDMPNLLNVDQTLDLQTQLVAFDDWVDVAYAATDAEARLLKFPSGELMSSRALQTTNPEVTIAGSCTHVDEVKFFASPKGDFRSIQPIGLDAAAVPMNAPAALSPNGGVVKIGDEYFGYAQIDGANLGRCTRGYLGSRAQVHDRERAFNFTGLLAVATVFGGTTADSDVIPLSQPIVANPEGYVLIEDEVVGYTWLSPRALLMPRTADGTGLYRGRFGTTPAQHGPNALAYAIPFRWWDTAVRGEFDNTMAYFAAGTSVRGATWHTFRYEQSPPELDDEDEEPPFVRAVAKIGARGSWTDAPNDSRSALFEFDEAGVDHALRYLPGDTFDARFFWAYPEGSFHPADAWKRDARLKRVSARHHSVTQTLLHEE